MEDNIQRERTWTGVLAGLMLLFLAGGIYFWVKTNDLTQKNDLTSQRADSLMSVKLQLEGDLKSINAQLQTANEEKNYFDKRLDDINGELDARDRVVSQLRQQNQSRTRTIQGLNLNVAVLNTKRDSLENQMAAVTDKVNWLTGENTRLTTQNNEIDPLRKQIADLNTTLLTMAPRAAITGDGFRVETVKGNQKETAKAKKVDKLLVSFSVPAELGLKGMEEVYLSLTDEHNNVMMAPLSTTNMVVAGANESIPVHATQSVDFSKNPQRVSFTITPDASVKPGLYRASIYTKDRYLGAAEFKLRDSFWFF